jgi:hypothetical protein
MNRAEHKLAAEQNLASARNARKGTGDQAFYLAAAQVHATLATVDDETDGAAARIAAKGETSA